MEGEHEDQKPEETGKQGTVTEEDSESGLSTQVVVGSEEEEEEAVEVKNASFDDPAVEKSDQPTEEESEAAPAAEKEEEGAGVVSLVKEVVLKGIDQSLDEGNVVSSLAQTVMMGIGEESAAGQSSRDVDIQEISRENKPFDVVIQRAKTSWKDCCGLFEAVKGLKQSNQ